MNIFRASSTLCTGVQLAASVNSPHWRKACSKFRSETPALDGVVPIGKNSATPPPPRPPVLAWTPAPRQRAERAPLAHVAVRVTDVAKKRRKLVLTLFSPIDRVEVVEVLHNTIGHHEASDFGTIPVATSHHHPVGRVLRTKHHSGRPRGEPRALFQGSQLSDCSGRFREEER